MTRGLAVDLAPIRVNDVCLGYVVTEVSVRFPTVSTGSVNDYDLVVGFFDG